MNAVARAVHSEATSTKPLNTNFRPPICSLTVLVPPPCRTMTLGRGPQQVYRDPSHISKMVPSTVHSGPPTCTLDRTVFELWPGGTVIPSTAILTDSSSPSSGFLELPIGASSPVPGFLISMRSTIDSTGRKTPPGQMPSPASCLKSCGHCRVVMGVVWKGLRVGLATG